MTRYFNIDFDGNGLFLLFIYFRKKKYINLDNQFLHKSITKGIEILSKRLFSLSIIVFSMKLLAILLIRKTKHLLGKMFGSPHTSNGNYLLRNCFSNYVYLKDTYITLKGIWKILFRSVLRILLICKFPNITAVMFTENFHFFQFSLNKINFPKFVYNFSCEKANFSLIHPTHITIQSYIQTNSRNSDY